MKNEYGHGLPSEVIDMQRVQNGILNTTLEALRGPKVLPWTWGDIMRDILREAHECFDGHWSMSGAWYVLRTEHGGLMLCPFGWNRSWRYRCWVRLDNEHDCWIFEVIS